MLPQLGTIRSDVGTKCSPNLGLFQCSHCTRSIVTAAMLQHGKRQKHDTRGSMTPFSHLLSFAYGLYMTTATLLNGHLYTEDYIIPLILCIPVTIFHLSLSRNVVLKCCLFLSTAAYIHPSYRLLLIK